MKNFPLPKDQRRGTFNAWNHPNRNAPNASPTSAAFGLITGQGQLRSCQSALKLEF